MTAVDEPSRQPSDVDAWLEAFAACVRARDHAGARDLFAPDAAGFGTVADRYDGLDELQLTQWSEVWERTTGFAFDGGDARWSTPDLCVVAATWRSRRADGPGSGERTGRATLVLRTDPDGSLRAVHSHFSMTPGTRA